MRFVVLGCGSIGRRHLRNLLSLGHSSVAQDPDPEQLSMVTEELGVPGFLEPEEALSQPADAALICSPTVHHLPQAIAAIKHSKHVFVEKPLSHTLRGTGKLVETAKEAGLAVLVACNLRFLPSLRLAKELMDAGNIGKPMAVRVHGGFYLPYWRPGADYRKGYGARSDLGGGVIRDFSHELDYVRWFFGSPNEVFCWAGKLSSLEIDIEDTAAILLRYPNGMVVQLQFDFLQPTYRRGMEIIGEKGTIVWDFIKQTVQLYGPENNQCREYLENINAELNSMYIEEMRHFVRCIDEGEKPLADAQEGRAVVELIEAAYQSSQQGRPVRLPLTST